MTSKRQSAIVLGDSKRSCTQGALAMDEPIPCPQCGAPARIAERFWLGSTDGPVEHVKTGCVNHHWLTPLAETLAAPQPPTIPTAAQLAHA
jgi:hypothetical protein